MIFSKKSFSRSQYKKKIKKSISDIRDVPKLTLQNFILRYKRYIVLYSAGRETLFTQINKKITLVYVFNFVKKC